MDNSESKRRRKNPKGNSALEIIPSDVWFNILARVASNSLDDLRNLRLSCKEMKALSIDDRVLRHANVEGFRIYPTFEDCPKLESFLLLCEKSGNPQALYRHGMIEYFKRSRLDVACELWKKAAKRGHDGAEYVLGIILLSGMDDKTAQQGMTILKGLEARLDNVELAEIRRKCMETLDSFHPPKFVKREEDFCPDLKCRDSAILFEGWDQDLSFWKHAYNKKCKLCKWDYELRRFRILQSPPSLCRN